MFCGGTIVMGNASVPMSSVQRTLLLGETLERMARRDEQGGRMEMQTASVTLPGELLAEINATVGPLDLTTFIVEMTKAELSRRRRYQSPAWAGSRRKVGGDPEPGTSAWMKGIREEGEARLTLRHF